MSSRIARKPVIIPKNVEVNITGQSIKIKGSKGEMAWNVHPLVNVSMTKNEDEKIGELNCDIIVFKALDDSKDAKAQSGTTRALVNNMVQGVHQGFEKRLQLVGVGYRSQVKGNSLSLTLGFSHPVNYPIPEGITIETPSQTEIVVTGVSRQRVGQVAAEIRAYRPPEPYKGKGVRYLDEQIVRKETKKK